MNKDFFHEPNQKKAIFIIVLSVIKRGRIMCYSKIKPFFLIFVVLCLCGYRIFSYFSDQENIYYYWDKILDKNSKPFHISQKEFVTKNREGYCWRDKKYYSEKKLKNKALVQFSSTLLNEIKKARNEELIKDGGDIERESAYFCKKDKVGCNLWFAPGRHTTEELKQYLLNNIPFSPRDEEELRKFNVKEIVNPDNLEMNINFFTEYALFGNSFLTSYILGSDCCSVITKQEFSKIKGYRIISAADNFSKGGKKPSEVIAEDYGIGNYYLSLNYFYYDMELLDSLENRDFKYARRFRNIKRVYFLSNCGDLLFKPYYSFN